MWGLQVSAGRGPVEVRRFVGRLGPALAAELAERGLRVISEACQGPVEAPWSVTLWLAGPDRPAVDDLLGTHCEVRRSAERGRRARKRWYAGVSLHRQPSAGPALDLGEITCRVSRARGPGGQNVNKRATAVRITHGPTGLSVRAEGERSQAANRAKALARLAALVAADEAARAARAGARRRAAHDRIERGRPVRIW